MQMLSLAAMQRYEGKGSRFVSIDLFPHPVKTHVNDFAMVAVVPPQGIFVTAINQTYLRSALWQVFSGCYNEAAMSKEAFYRSMASRIDNLQASLCGIGLMVAEIFKTEEVRSSFVISPEIPQVLSFTSDLWVAFSPIGDFELATQKTLPKILEFAQRYPGLDNPVG